ncbi:MAG: hypothetical protein ACR2KQ_03640 [Actinomycetota bacterium]
MTNQDLEALDSRELHERAIALAKEKRDLGFAWRLLKALPAAQAAGGDVEEAQGDIMKLSALLTDAINTSSDPGALEGLRPLYIDYLRSHS